MNQFIVISMGSERVAEVAARFTLDAMPGKQMLIHNYRRRTDPPLRRWSAPQESKLPTGEHRLEAITAACNAEDRI